MKALILAWFVELQKLLSKRPALRGMYRFICSHCSRRKQSTAPTYPVVERPILSLVAFSRFRSANPG